MAGASGAFLEAKWRRRSAGELTGLQANLPAAWTLFGEQT